jgi:hypothetical protein
VDIAGLFRRTRSTDRNGLREPVVACEPARSDSDVLLDGLVNELPEDRATANRTGRQTRHRT